MTFLLAAGDTVGATSAAMGSGHYNYWLVIVLMMTGLYVVLSRSNMIKTVIGLNLFQVAVIIFYITMGKVSGGTAPIEIKSLTKAQLKVAALRDMQAVPPDEFQAVMKYLKEASGQLPDGPVSAELNEVIAQMQPFVDQELGPESGAEMKTVIISVEQRLAGLVVYSHPLPHVLMLTAIVVGIATISLALALIVRINEAYDTIEEDEILALEAGT
jgi:multicomponent Na+:H+ antiporter subunit C